MKLAIIGAGKMATALAGGLVMERELAAQEIIACDVSPEARRYFQEKTGVQCSDSARAILPGADVVLLAVKPQNAKEAIAEIADLCEGKLILSILAGVTLRTLCDWFQSKRIIRIMPNTPLMVGQGATVFTCAPEISEYDRLLTRSFFKVMGLVFDLPEDQMDAVTALSGSGPAYIFEMVQALVDAAEEAGIDPEVALDLTVQTVAGAAEMLRRRMGTPDELRTAVTSPGGTTAAGLKVLGDAQFRATINAVIKAAKNRSQELGRLI